MIRRLGPLVSVVLGGCFLSHTVDAVAPRDAGPDLPPDDGPFDAGPPPPDCGLLPDAGACMLPVPTGYFPSPDAHGMCLVQVCLGEPVELCVPRGSGAGEAVRSMLPGVQCEDPSMHWMSLCDATEDSCDWMTGFRPGATFTGFTADDWARLCAASMLPGVTRVQCVPPVLI